MNRTALINWWQSLATRERNLLGLGGLVVILVAGYLLLWEPPMLGVRKLETDLPQLRAQNAAMRTMADEATRLRATAGNTTTIATTDRTAAVKRSLQRAGLLSTAPTSADASASAKPIDTTSGQVVQTLSVNGAVTTVANAPVARSAPPEVSADGERVRVRFDDIDYGVWVGWLAAAEGELAARASRVMVSSTAPKGPVGHVRAEAVLDWTQPAPSSSSASSSPSRP
jgi:type II secretory pathway component PulM